MRHLLVLFLVMAVLFSACGGEKGKSTGTDKSVSSVTLILGAYTVPKEAYQRGIIPAFQKMWKEKTGQEVNFQESYIASGEQSRNIAAGFEADIAALSLEQDIDRLANNGLITHDWKAKKFNGFVTRSLVVMVHRPNNPKNVKTWEDLTRSDIDVIYPNPRMSGGAMWFVNAIYGAGLKKIELETGTKDSDQARANAKKLLKDIQARVKVMDKSGRASVTTFESGFGDVMLTYENEALLRQMQGKDFPFIIPDATMLIENPIAVVDKYVEKHGTRQVAEAFLEFVYTQEAQRYFADYGFRAVDETVAKEFAAKYPVPKHLFDMSYLGGWGKVNTDIYGAQGVWTLVIQELGQNEK
ncbi:MAG: sulfate ABC transporter substrate-binding protein [Acidobacteria bacterium]|jgi:sulfate transport system substrate-binding protein|nr:sulfate ABC transporter substrate-binding protein [Acidobacteriota bacterium]